MTKTNPTAADVAAAANRLGRHIETAQAEPLAAYLDQLVTWNRKMNLVGPGKWQAIFDTLVVDSLHLADFLPTLDLPDDPLTLDLGAGAGLPGIPLRALWQAGDYWLVEVRQKRALFMQSVVGKLRLPGTHVFHGRAEAVMDHLAETGRVRADLILSRAFMPWPKLLDFTRPMLSDTGTLVILANTPPPGADQLPAGWRLGDAMRYAVARGERFFWSLHPTG